jgi:4-amino-4-deoxy-L-arabinose transferase-like glycosyltransferase
MAEPIPPHPVDVPPRISRWRRALAGSASLALILEIALGLRILAADAVDRYVHRGGSERLCLFDDTIIYWGLARTIREGTTYEYVEWSDIPHFAIRTPGYPLFLAACQSVFGERTLAVRLVQGLLGVASVYLIYRLTCRIVPAVTLAITDNTSTRRRWTTALVAAAIAALNPYYLFMSTLVLSEAVFVPLMLASLWGLAVLWVEPGQSNRLSRDAGLLVALASGAAAGLAILVRPSWGLFVPVVLLIWLADRGSDRNSLLEVSRGALVFALALVLTMSPWWVRNARIYGRFVPTALWMGASLYDGLNSKATGASDMSFLADPEIWPLDEQDQDALLTRRAAAFARRNPAYTIRLALIKLARYWSPWPNAQGYRSPLLAVAGAVVEIPIFALMALGAWDRRRDLRAWALLAGPLFYFCAIHLAFASSMRYRIPGEMPALGLAAIGWMTLSTFWPNKGDRVLGSEVGR